MARVDFQPAFLLHARPFRDTSLLVDFFTKEHGRVHAVVRGAKSAKSKIKGLLLPFVPLLISWSGKTDLMTLTKVEANGAAYDLRGSNLLSGFYINELITKLLHKYDPHPEIYLAYQELLENITVPDQLESSLRIFEKKLLTAIGYGLQCNQDSEGKKIDPNMQYEYQHELGFRCWDGMQTAFVISGQTLLNMKGDKFDDPQTKKEAKRLMRQVFDHLLEGKVLKSRELFK